MSTSSPTEPLADRPVGLAGLPRLMLTCRTERAEDDGNDDDDDEGDEEEEEENEEEVQEGAAVR